MSAADGAPASRDLPAVARLHIRPNGLEAAFAYCLEQSVLGMGWPVDHPDSDELTWADYERLARERYGKVNPNVQRLRDLPVGALVWTRDHAGRYYIAEVTGGWHHKWSGPEYETANVRAARYELVGVESAVPGAVVAGFRSPMTLQAVGDEAARLYTTHRYAELAGRPGPEWRPSLDEVLSSLLGAGELEDLVAVYLQAELGYLLVPQPGRSDTIAYEYVLRHPDTGEEAVVQVKTGKTPVPTGSDALPTGSVERCFVFSASGTYASDWAPGVERLSPEALVSFMREQRNALPKLVEHWVGFACA